MLRGLTGILEAPWNVLYRTQHVVQREIERVLDSRCNVTTSSSACRMVTGNHWLIVATV
jgi:hypothetical protein